MGFFSMNENHTEESGRRVRAKIRENIDLLLRGFYGLLLQQAQNDQKFIERMNTLTPQ